MTHEDWVNKIANVRIVTDHIDEMIRHGFNYGRLTYVRLRLTDNSPFHFSKKELQRLPVRKLKKLHRIITGI